MSNEQIYLYRVFLSGNFAKVTPVRAFDDTVYRDNPVTKRAMALYRDFAQASQ